MNVSLSVLERIRIVSMRGYSMQNEDPGFTSKLYNYTQILLSSTNLNLNSKIHFSVTGERVQADSHLSMFSQK
jgi:hypothetical protein